MIIVDSCVWIDYFNGANTPEVEWLADNFEVQQILLPDIITLEVLRGFKLDKDFKTALAFFEDLQSVEILGFERAISASKKYRLLRTKGVTVRKPGDAVIASYCIYENHELLTSDRDFAPYAAYLGL